MNCPLCNKKIVVVTNEWTSTWRCHSIEESVNGETWSHYIKDFISYHPVPFYIETAILLPYRIDNSYEHTDRSKPYCNIFKRVMTMSNYGPRWKWEPVLSLSKPLEIIKYKKMRTRLQTVIVMS